MRQQDKVILVLEEPDPPITMYAQGGQPYQIDGCMHHLLRRKMVVWNEEKQHFEVSVLLSGHVGHNGAEYHPKMIPLAVFVSETLREDAVKQTERIVFADKNPANLTIENLRVERLPFSLPAPRGRRKSA